MHGTKEKILTEAMQLFSVRGYQEVSVRDIAGQVGIRESSLYNHFAGKKAIFDEIISKSVREMENSFRSVKVPPRAGTSVSMYDNLSNEQLEEKIMDTFRVFFENESAVLLRRILIISQFEREECRRLYRQFFYEEPVRIQTEVFARQMETGAFVKADPQKAAMEFYGPVFLLLHVCDSFEQMRGPLCSHLQEFLRHYAKKESV